jgi:hypothetical protein
MSIVSRKRTIPHQSNIRQFADNLHLIIVSSPSKTESERCQNWCQACQNESDNVMADLPGWDSLGTITRYHSVPAVSGIVVLVMLHSSRPLSATSIAGRDKDEARSGGRPYLGELQVERAGDLADRLDGDTGRPRPCVA